MGEVIKDTEEFDSDGELNEDSNTEDTNSDEESVEEEESEEQAGEDEIEEEKVDDEVEETPAPEKLYLFNGRQLTADELHAEAGKLQADYTIKSQELSQLKGPKETPKSSKYTPEQIAEFKEFARESGIVLAEDLQKSEAEKQQKSILEGFLGKHPDYKDPVKSQQLFKQLEEYNTALPYLAKSLEKAHKDLNPNSDDDVKEAKARANVVKQARSTAGVGTGAKKVNSSNNYTPEQIETMKRMGVWDED